MAPDAWFADARFGLFVHWGMFSARGLEPSWPLVGGMAAFPMCQDLTVEEYYQGDLVAEFVDATRAAGLRVGLYYSLSDWAHPDYPAFSDDMRPYQFMAYPRSDPDAWARYLSDLRGQLDELLTRYGPIDLLWFDGGWERSAEEWDSAGLERFIRDRQPGIVINDRLPGVGDYASPEQSVPTAADPGWWETCMTMNHSWGPVATDDNYKSSRLPASCGPRSR